MFQRFHIYTFFTAFLFLTLNTSLQAKDGMAYYVGSGLAYPTLNRAPTTNPSALVDSSQLNLQGLYLVDDGEIHGSLTSGHGNFALGGTYTTFSSTSIEEIAGALRFSTFALGWTMRGSEFSNFSHDAALTFDGGKYRVSVVGRDVLDEFTRLDVGIGFMSGPLNVGIDVKKPLATGAEDFWFFDAGVTYAAGKLQIGGGYVITYDGNGFTDGNAHAGLSFMVVDSVALEAFYNPNTQEFAGGEIVAGARFQL